MHSRQMALGKDARVPTLEHGQRHQQVGEDCKEEVDDVRSAAPAHIYKLQHRVRLGRLVLELICHHCMSRASPTQILTLTHQRALHDH